MTTARNIFLCFYIFLIPSLVFTQTWDWVRLISGAGNHITSDISISDNGDLAATGTIKLRTLFDSPVNAQNPRGFGDADIFVAKYNTNGNLQWVNRLGGTEADWGIGVLASATGAVYATGFFRDSISIGNFNMEPSDPDSRNAFFIKYDESGNVVWAKPAYSNNDSRGISIIEDSEHNIYFCGLSEGRLVFDSDSIGMEGIDFPYIVKYSEAGDFIWAKQLRDEGNVNNLAITSDDVIFYGGNIGAATTSRGLLFGAIDVDGNILWDLTGQTPGSDIVTSISISHNDAMYACGKFARGMDLGTLTIEDTNQQEDAFITKISKTGEVTLLKEVIKSDTAFQIFGLEVYGDNIMVGGRFWGSIEIENTTYSSVGGGDGFVANFDTLGNLKWYKHFGSAPVVDCGSECSEGIRALAVDSDRNAYLSGNFKNDTEFDSLIFEGNEGSTSFIAKFFPPIESKIENQSEAICLGDSITFSAESNGSPLNYKWIFEGGSPETSLQPNPNISFSQSGTYEVILEVSNVNEIDTVSKLIEIEVFDLPQINLGADTTICENETLEILLDPSFSSYAWSTGNTSSSIEIDTAGTYSITVTDFNNCINSDSIIIEEKSCSSGLGSKIQTELINMSPNPFSDRFWFDFPYTSGHMNIYNVFGKVIEKRIALHKGKNLVEMSSDVSGIIFYTIEGDNATQLFSGKLIKN